MSKSKTLDDIALEKAKKYVNKITPQDYYMHTKETLEGRSNVISTKSSLN